MILSTCNRSEIYYFYEKESQVKAIQDIYCDMFEKVQIRQYIRHCEEDKAVSYLFRVTAGLESDGTRRRPDSWTSKRCLRFFENNGI